jgi:NitT/TauT family transport system permease protein
MLSGYVLAATVGIAVGMLVGLIKPFYDATVGIVDFFRSIPVTSLYPVFVLSLGIGHSSKIAMVFWASFFVIALNSAYGVLQSPKLRAQMANLYGAKGTQIFRWIVFYDALPQTMIGLRIALSYALIVEMLCEMFMGSELGIGQRLTEAWTTYAIDNLYALIMLAGLFGFLLNRVFVYIERRAVPWVIR